MDKNSFLLKINSQENIDYLEDNGYENVQKISFENMRAKVVVVDELEKSFNAISVTCLAGMNIKPINFEEFKVINTINNCGADDLGC